MEKCHNCNKKTTLQICSTCKVLVCLLCFNFHLDHQLKIIRDYLSELLSKKQSDLAMHFDFIAKANDIKVSLESSLRKLKKSDEAEEVQGKITELVKYISEVTAISEHLEQLTHIVETTVVDKPMAFIREIENIKISINIPKYLNEAKAQNTEKDRFRFRDDITLEVENLINKLNEENKLEFIELEKTANRTNEKIDISKSIKKMELLYIKLKKDFLNILYKEQENIQLIDFNNSNKDLIGEVEDNKKRMAEIEDNKKKVAEIKANKKAMTKELKEVENKVTKMKETIKNQNTEVEKAKKRITLQQQQIKALEETESRLQKLNISLKEENEQVIKEIQEFKDKLTQTESEYKKMQTAHSKLIEDINKENDRLQVLTKEVMIQESKCKEAKSLQEYKKITDQKITALTEASKKSVEKNMRLRNELKRLRDQVMNMSGFTKKLISLFHKRRNTLHKAVQQIVMDEKMAYTKHIQLITKEINYNKNYKERMTVLLNEVKAAIKEAKVPLKVLKSEIVNKNPDFRTLDSVKSLRSLLCDTATFTNSLKKLYKAPLDDVVELSALYTNKKFKDVFKILSNYMKDLKLALNNANKQIAEIESKKETTKKQIVSLLKSYEEEWDLCEAKEDAIKYNIIDVVKSYLQIK